MRRRQTGERGVEQTEDFPSCPSRTRHRSRTVRVVTGDAGGERLAGWASSGGWPGKETSAGGRTTKQQTVAVTAPKLVELELEADRERRRQQSLSAVLCQRASYYHYGDTPRSAAKICSRPILPFWTPMQLVVCTRCGRWVGRCARRQTFALLLPG